MLLTFILVPLIGAALMPIFRKAWPQAAAALPIIATLYQVGAVSVVAFHNLVAKDSVTLEHWLLNQKLMLSVDGLSVVALLSIGLVTLVSVLFACKFPLDPDRRPGYFALILLAVAGMNGLVMATDLFSLYVFLEIASICSFILIAYQYENQGLEGSYKYMMLSAVATVFLLLGISLLFALTGGVSFTDMAAGMQAGSLPIKLGLSFLFFAFTLKAGMMPFHAWLPDAYTGAPAPVSIFLGGIVTKIAGVYTLMRLVLNVFGFTKSFSLLLLILGAVSALLGALIALRQRDFKRMLAFSSISQIGYIMMGFATGSPLGLVGAVFHFFNHAVFKSLLFVNAGAVEMATGTRNLDELGGLSSKMPVTGTTSVIGLLSAAGVPPLAGFWSKLIIIIALWASGYQFFAAVAVFTSVITLAYLLSLQRSVFFGKLRAGLENITEVSPVAYWPEIIMAAITVAAGVLFPLFYSKLLLPVNSMISMIFK